MDNKFRKQFYRDMIIATALGAVLAIPIFITLILMLASFGLV